MAALSEVEITEISEALASVRETLFSAPGLRGEEVFMLPEPDTITTAAATPKTPTQAAAPPNMRIGDFLADCTITGVTGDRASSSPAASSAFHAALTYFKSISFIALNKSFSFILTLLS